MPTVDSDASVVPAWIADVPPNVNADGSAGAVVVVMVVVEPGALATVGGASSARRGLPSDEQPASEPAMARAAKTGRVLPSRIRRDYEHLPKMSVAQWDAKLSRRVTDVLIHQTLSSMFICSDYTSNIRFCQR
ncbi:hypothetical protein nbrc107696_13060 [Gordonia spumicola]|uniref:Uncharacterized protein n=1 Tax=Gordonia spumicola TaxID=589161 RepID=A0A7I9V718_9ACTN|nr:hypothetical protein nbrc107696_13060 [Gordonia spumicola]